ncbi:hypothetical protein [Wolbachia endosymbiont of Litomosoides sigmodontis]|uniref:hypothetical protein n=1 Tax=Wolbachia endosymbiont of Litomosoides sigmodontis TaxID=80850 RepID=UPI00267338D5|nr:hypothetical protein [Wolbachia endosymbiont of Litomosoides sigmodontis]
MPARLQHTVICKNKVFSHILRQDQLTMNKIKIDRKSFKELKKLFSLNESQFACIQKLDTHD